MARRCFVIDVRPEEGRGHCHEADKFFRSIKIPTCSPSWIAGEGALLKQLEERKKRLDAEGLLAQERKKQLPSFPRTIGIVTSPTGAVIQDILHRIADRFGVHVLVWPVLVQGQGSAEQVAEAKRFNLIDGAGAVPRPDLPAQGGGGALEDLMSFNDEDVVRAAADDIPLISSIGHETDTTLLDFVADRRSHQRLLQDGNSR